MTDHKFTDDEIIHSLKVCSTDGDCSECKINPHKGNYGYCTSLAIKTALDLINRQKNALEREIYNGLKADEEIEYLKAEIERLQKLGAAATRRLVEVKAEANKEIERLNKEVDRLSQCVLCHDGIVSDLEKDVFNAKSEAIKEFAQRLKTLKIKPEFPWDDFFVTEEMIDTLVKEMTEEQTNESQST